jgi:hypothetical protein
VNRVRNSICLLALSYSCLVTARHRSAGGSAAFAERNSAAVTISPITQAKIPMRANKVSFHLLTLLQTHGTAGILMSCGRDEIGARIAPATIARQHVRQAFFDRAIVAIPVHVAIASRRYGAPGRLGQPAEG